MTTTIKGSDWLAFRADRRFWPKGETSVYAENVDLLVDGKPMGGGDAAATGAIKPESTVTIYAGDVFEGVDRLHTLQEHYDSWASGHEPGGAQP